MKLKYIAIAAFVIIVGTLTAPYWGGCKVVYQTCKLSCEVRHFNDGLKKAGCKTSCAADRLKCQSR